MKYRCLAGLFLLAFARLAAADGGASRVTDAIAAALEDARVRVVTHVPATGATEVFDAWCERTGAPKVYSFNEEVAYTVAHGAALAGVRAATVLKSHGFAKAANSVVDSITAGTTAGFVVLVFHDRTGAHSDSVFDTRAFVKGTRILHLAPRPGALYAEILQAFRLSERYRSPVAVVVDSDDLGRPARWARAPLPPPTAVYRRNVYQHLLCPLLAPYQHRLLAARMAGAPPPRDRPALPSVPDRLPPRFKATALQYAPLFDAFKQVKGPDAMVAGDAGTSSLFAFPPYESIDVTTY
ncbi:MAG TPA: thiamine pyrophosphate-binding protein [Thermoanaerobaculaceae bacterium]|nr:thiamine pyrophosphate-binding protein [Thermoanaerobaculaceae bacterium]HRS16965.1 thiamine pyrophosphate-binding protein [Thermoanaerobaculaceae bacterium]